MKNEGFVVEVVGLPNVSLAKGKHHFCVKKRFANANKMFFLAFAEVSQERKDEKMITV
jgi:hypothetical protein